MDEVRGRARLLVRFALAAALLAGCGGMPDSGAAGAGREVGDTAIELLAAPLGPRPGAPPAEIVGGFLRAGAGSGDDHAVARSFLTAVAARSWRPSREVVVYGDDSLLQVGVRGTRSPVRVDVRVPVQATIDAQGRYAEARPGASAHASFTLTETDGTWRVSALDPAFGSWLPRYELDRTFSALQVSFVAAGSQTLVPDLRWFAGPRPGLATALVRQLLLGPPAHLGDAVVTGFPAGTRLAVDAVPTTDGVAQVDLSAPALTASSAMRKMMWAQLTSTLRRLPSVARLELTVAGAPFEVPGVKSSSVYGDTSYRDDVRVTGAPVVLVGQRLARVDPVKGVLTTGSFPLPVGQSEGLRSVSVGPGASVVVAVDDTGRRLLRLRPGDKRVVLLTGGHLLDPVIDTTGALWSADLDQPGRLRVVPADVVAAGVGLSNEGPATTDTPGRVQLVEPTWLARRFLHSIDISRDGTRAVVVSAAVASPRAGATRVDVAGVVRGAGGQPIALSAPLEVAQSLTRVTDAAWADRTALVVLGRGANEKLVTPYEVVVGGAASALPQVKGALTVAAGDGLRAVYVTTAAGTLLGRSGVGWATVGAGRSVSIPE